MATRAKSPPIDNVAELVKRLGGIPLKRICMQPPPGTATEKDLIAALEAPRKRICELVDGVLVEKAVGTREGLIAAIIIQLMWNHVEREDLGVVIAGDGPFRLWLGLVRVPDVSFISWGRIPGGEFPDTPIARLIPNLAVEVRSKSNTRKEMERKLKEYFHAGVMRVWLIDPKTETAEIFSSPTDKKKIGKDEGLEGEDILPGFRLPLKKLFSRFKQKGKNGR